MEELDQDRVRVADEYAGLLKTLGLTSLAAVKAFHGEFVKNQRGRRDVSRITVTDADGRTQALFLKRHWRPYKKDGLTSLLRRGSVWSIARQEWENSRALEGAGLCVAGLVAYGEECGPLWEKFSFILTEAASGQTVRQLLRDSREPATRRRVFDALARTIQRMHDAGLATPDLFTHHIFVRPAAGEPEFCLIDMARMDRNTRLSDRRRARDLAALNLTAPLRLVSTRERLRFLRVYAGGKCGPLARLIAKRMERLLKRRKYQAFWEE